MSVSTDGQICYGIFFDEGFEFPWNKDGEEGDLEEWWTKVNGFKPSIEIWDKDGGYLNGKKPSEEEQSKYYKEKREWELAHPLPVQLVNCCTDGYPIYILAVPESVQTCSRGNPEPIDLQKLINIDTAVAQALIEFCNKYGIKMDSPPTWLLSSYWG